MTTQFVEMYHPNIPSTAVTPALVATQAVDEQYAKGWLLVDPDAPPPVVNTPYYTKEALLSQIEGGASPIGTALTAAFGRQTKAHSDPAGLPNGTPTSLLSGQAAQSFGTAPITLSGGRYRHTPFAGTNSAGYLQADLGAKVTRIGATAVFPAGADGNVTFVLPSGRWDTVAGLVPAGVHFVVTPTMWHISAWGSSGETIYAQGGFATSLADGTVKRIELVRDGATAYLSLPDGRVVEVTDSRIDTQVSDWAIWELYEADGTTDTPAEIVSLWADVDTPFPATPTPVELAAARADIPATPFYKRAAPSGEFLAVAAYPGPELTRATAVVPQNRKLWVRLSAYLTFAAATEVFFLCRITAQGGTGGDDKWFQMVANQAAGEGRFSCEDLVDLSATAFGAGDAVDVLFLAFGSSPGSATAWLDGPSGRAATMFLSPVAS